MPKKKSEARHAQTLGAAYRSASMGAIVAAPAIAVVGPALGGGGQAIGRDLAREVYDAYRNEAGPIVGGIVTTALDQLIGQKALNHNSALGRGSITAWAGELAAAGPAALVASQQGGQAGLRSFTGAKSGYQAGGGWDFGRMKLYLTAKYGFGIARKLSSMSLFRPVFNPVKKGLSGMGATL